MVASERGCESGSHFGDKHALGCDVDRSRRGCAGPETGAGVRRSSHKELRKTGSRRCAPVDVGRPSSSGSSGPNGLDRMTCLAILRHNGGPGDRHKAGTTATRDFFAQLRFGPLIQRKADPSMLFTLLPRAGLRPSLKRLAAFSQIVRNGQVQLHADPIEEQANGGGKKRRARIDRGGEANPLKRVGRLDGGC